MLDRLNELLKKLPGFSPFSEDDIQSFLESPNVHSLTFKKEKGKGYLYGKELVGYRRSILNDLPKDRRVEVVQKKCEAIGALSYIADFVGEESIYITDAKDIGMGHSVYALTLSSGDALILKSVESHNPVFFTDVLATLKWPYIPLKCFDTSVGTWMISSFVGGENCSDYFCETGVSEVVVQQLANQACLSDILGRGDRHFENYIIDEGVVYPIDISYLFWPENEVWVDRYIRGGQSEFCVCAESELLNRVFWETYKESYESLKKLAPLLESVIRSHFSVEEATDYSRYMYERLESSTYYQRRIESCVRELQVYKRRLRDKQRLADRVKNEPALLDQDPMLYMYYHANKSRMTTFFMLEYFERESLLTVF